MSRRTPTRIDMQIFRRVSSATSVRTSSRCSRLHRDVLRPVAHLNVRPHPGFDIPYLFKDDRVIGRSGRSKLNKMPAMTS